MDFYTGGFMESEWLKNEKSIEHVRRLLNNAGLPLEVRTGQICRKFIDELDENYPSEHYPDGTYKRYNLFYTDRRVYGDEEAGDAHREVDQCVTLSHTIDLSEGMSLNFDLDIPIECKHRDNIEVFGFATGDLEYIYNRFVMSTNLGGSQILKSIALRELSILQTGSLYSLGFLEIEGQTPKRAVEENIIYKAGSALYDFIKFKSSYNSMINQEELANVIKSLDIDSKLIITSNANKLKYAWNANLAVIHDIPEDKRKEFNKAISGLHIFESNIYVPIICIDGPLYSVKVDEGGKVQDFSHKPYLISGVRPSSWAGNTKYTLNASPESLVIVTNPENLDTILQELAEWYMDLADILYQASPEAIEMVTIEGLIYNYLTDQIT